MKTIEFKGWKISTHSVSQCFGAVMTDPSGNTYHQSNVCWYNHLSARRYAEKFIQWYIELENGRCKP